VPELYETRKQLGSNTRGYPLKLCLNSLYGKMAQRSGRGPYHDAVAAGLVTAMARARLVEAVGHNPEAVVMIATDAVYSTEPLPLDIGDGLGQWEDGRLFAFASCGHGAAHAVVGNGPKPASRAAKKGAGSWPLGEMQPVPMRP
jgi:hypothetical protein